MIDKMSRGVSSSSGSPAGSRSVGKRGLNPHIFHYWVYVDLMGRENWLFDAFGNHTC